MYGSTIPTPSRDFTTSFSVQPTTTIRNDLYPIRGYLLTGEEDSEPLSVMEIYSHEDDDSYYKLKRPTQDNLPHSKLVFCGGVVEDGAFCSVGTHSIRWVSFDDADGTPEVGDYVGTKTDSYKLFAYKFGFQCLEYDASNELILVRPCPLMPLLVKAVTSEVSGEIDVQYCDYEGTVYRDAFTVKVLPS